MASPPGASESRVSEQISGESVSAGVLSLGEFGPRRLCSLLSHSLSESLIRESVPVRGSLIHVSCRSADSGRVNGGMRRCR